MTKASPTFTQEIRTIRRAVQVLSNALSRIDTALAAVIHADGAGMSQVKRARKKPALTPARRAALKLHGRYIGTIRMLPAAKKAKVRKVHAEKGVRAAIAYARSLEWR